MLKNRWLPWGLLVLACTLFGYFDALGSYAASPRSQEWMRILGWDLTNWYLWILLAPFAIRFGRRFRIDRSNWHRRLLAHIPASLAFAIVHSVLLLCIGFTSFYHIDGLRLFLLRRYFVLISDFLVGMVIYGMILALVHALDYYRQYREGELRASQLEAQLARAQLQALKMQLHPHFLFNTLHSISALQMQDIWAAQKMTARLGDFLRLTLENVGAQEVTLKEEMEFLKCYLDIEHVRLGHRLTVNIQVAPETLDAQVPNLILQPVVENAIRHGIAPQVSPGRIDIIAKRDHERLQVQIKDNGPGLAMKGDCAGLYNKGLGLVNTRARLDQLYGADYRFDLANAPEGGTVVTLDIPFNTNEIVETFNRERSFDRQ